LNLDFSSAVAKFETLTSKMRLTEPTQAEVFLAGGERANAIPERVEPITVDAEVVND
jgi:hypothetical protein